MNELRGGKRKKFASKLKKLFLIVKGSEIDFLYSSFIAFRLSLNNEFQLRLINLKMIVSLVFGVKF
jgi:hypothetical protein